MPENEIPYFCWDRPWTVGDVRKRLAALAWPEKADLVAWIMREAAFADVWQFVSPAEVGAHLDILTPMLGRRRELWEYIVRTWRDMGKLQSGHAT